MRYTPEEREQIALMTWARITRLRGILVSDFLIAIPNGGHRHKLTAYKLQQQGVKPGVSDLFLALPANGFCGLWIELKAGKGKPTALQVEWLTAMSQVGYAARLCVGWVAAKETIEEYLA